MFRFAVIRVAVALLMLSVSAAALAQSGFLQVRAQPGIQVFVDDVFVGVTNADVGGLIVTDVRVGARRLRFVREGFLPQDATVNVAAGQVLLYEVGSLVARVQVTQEGSGGAAEMRVETGTLVVQCLPIECVVNVPALGIGNVRKTQDRLVARGVPVGSYSGQLSVGSNVRPVSFGVCPDDTVTLFGTFVGASQGVAVTSAANLSWPRCEPVRLSVVPDATMVLVGDRLPLSVRVEGLEPSGLVWSASAGSIEGSGASVVFVAPSSAGPVTLAVASADNPAWRDEVVVTVAPFVVEGFRAEPAGGLAGEAVTFSWALVAGAAADAAFACTLSVLDAAGSREETIDDCGRVTSVAVVLGAAGPVSARLRASDGVSEVIAALELVVRAPPAPTFVSVSNVAVVAAGGGAREVAFDVAWPESWRGPARPSWVAASDNWDAAWVFVKVRVDGGAWRHATLRTVGHVGPEGVAIDVPRDGMGAFVYRDAPGYGAFDARGVRLAWDTVADAVPLAASVDVQVFALAMVFVPRGGFVLGSGGDEAGAFRGGASGAPFVVSGSAPIVLGGAAGQLTWPASSGSGTPSGSTAAAFPTGFEAYYLMRHPATQGEYVNFLNTLTQAQADARMHTGSSNRYAIAGDRVGAFTTSLPFVALNYVSWADGAAFADWAGLRPLTELEFEKAARGPLAPVANEFAWGSTSIVQATGLENAGTVSEAPTPAGANAAFGRGVQGPLRVGSFAAPGRSREEAGAGFYGVLELSGGLSERAVTVGNAEGRAFAGTHGDGALDAGGNANVVSWPGSNAVGAGFRGGRWSGAATYLRVSDRSVAAGTNADRYDLNGWRGARSAP